MSRPFPGHAVACRALCFVLYSAFGLTTACSEPAPVAAPTDVPAPADAALDATVADTAPADTADTALADAPGPADATDADTAGPLCPVSGAAAGPVDFAPGQKGPVGVAIDGGHVYWTATNGLYRKALQGGAVEPLDLGAGSGGPVAVGAAHVFFAHANTGQIVRVAKTGGPASVLATTTAVRGLALGAGRVWLTAWLDNGFVASVAEAGGELQILANEQAFPHGVAVAGGQVVWTTAGGDGKGTPGRVMVASTTGLGVSPLAGNEDGAGAVVVQGGRVFFARGAKVRSVAVDASELQGVATDVAPIQDLALDGGELFWTSGGGGQGRVVRASTQGGPLVALAAGQKAPRGVAVGGGCVAWADFGTGPTAGNGAIRVVARAAAGEPLVPCPGPNPQGCYGKGKPACPDNAAGEAQTCAPNGKQDGCIPYACTCDTATGQWACDGDCSGGLCKPLCQTLAPDAYCCQDGQFAQPACFDGVFSCPAGTVAKPFGGCGPFVGDKSSFVTCDKSACKEGDHCCFEIVPNCGQQTSCYAMQTCEGSHHCQPGEVCCATQGTYVATACVPAGTCTASQQRQACADDGDCPAGQSCCAKAKTGKFGLCWAGPCG